LHSHKIEGLKEKIGHFFYDPDTREEHLIGIIRFANGDEHRGHFVNGELIKGEQYLANGERVWVNPELLVTDQEARRTPRELPLPQPLPLLRPRAEREDTRSANQTPKPQINIACVQNPTCDQEILIPVQKPVPAQGIYHSYKGTLHQALIDMACQGTAFHQIAWDKISEKDQACFIAYLFTQKIDAETGVPHYLIERLPLPWILAILEQSPPIPPKIVDLLFVRYAGEGHTELTRKLLTLKPDLVTLHRPPIDGNDLRHSPFAKAMAQGYAEEARILCDAMCAQKVEFSHHEMWWKRILNNDANFDLEALNTLVEPNSYQLRRHGEPLTVFLTRAYALHHEAGHPTDAFIRRLLYLLPKKWSVPYTQTTMAHRFYRSRGARIINQFLEYLPIRSRIAETKDPIHTFASDVQQIIQRLLTALERGCSEEFTTSAEALEETLRHLAILLESAQRAS
jgi:hypothetical protein